MIRPDQEAELHRYFSGVLAAAMGLRSTMAGQIAVLRLGVTSSSGNADWAEERSLEAAWEFRRTSECLRQLDDADRRVLRLLYEPMGIGESDGLDIFGPNARVAVVLYGLTHKRSNTTLTLADYTVARQSLANLCKRARSLKDPSRQDAAALVYGLAFQAVARAGRAQDAYARSTERRDDVTRPWYVPSVAGRSAW
jgi:hypothetical protein